ncbi:MAG: hypothetical protein J6C33_00410 [Lachnospiraceae bacterium]|nr:hypothetical protein [Lachnospiraceae bacterium]
MGEGFTKEAYEVVYKHPQWKQEATRYEDRMAAKLFHMSYTKEAVKTAMGKISRILTAYYGDGGQTLDRQREEAVEAAGGLTDLAELFGEDTSEVKVNKTLVTALMQGRRDNSGAGQVRKLQAGDPKEGGGVYTQEEADRANMETLDAVMNRDGNLREQMTLLYNGMFVNGGYTPEQIAHGASFKGVLQGITRENGVCSLNPDLMGIDYDLLEGLERYQKKEDVFDTYSMGRDLQRRSEELTGKGNRLTRWWRGMKRALNATLHNSMLRKKRRTPLREGEAGLGLQHYEQLGIGPSAREREYSVITQEEDGQRHEKLLWKEGAAYYQVKKEVTAEGMLQTAGASGTTLRMLGAYRLMGASRKELLDFRLALIAWMVSSHDHSLYEILQGSHNAGVVGTEDLSEAAAMYTNVDPLDTEILREHFAENKQFPHEIIYKRQLNELKEAREARERKLGRDEVRRDRIIESGALKDQYEVIDGLLKKRRNDLRTLERKITSLINRLLLDPAKAFKGDTDGSRRREAEENLMQAQMDLFYLKEDVQKIQDKYNEVNARRQSVELLPELTLFAKSAVTQGTDAMELRAQDLALNIYTTGAYMTMNVGSKWGGTLGKMKLKDDRVDEKKFGSYQSSYKAETKDGKLLDQIFAMTRLSARMAQDALEERGSREQEREDEADYLHAARVNTFRGEKSGGGGYRTQGSEYDTKALTSTSKRLEKALMYFGKSAESAGYDRSVLALYQLTGKGAVDITQLSKVANEEEVLVPSGTRFRVETPLVKNVSVEALRRDPEHIVSDAVGDDAVAAEFALNEEGKVNYGGIKHVNVVRLVEVDGPGARRRRAADASRWTREQIKRSLAQ